jgi:hypothetical protein
MEKMIYSIMEKMGSCINDSQWKIGAFLTNSYANPKKFRSRITAMNATLPLFWNRASGMRTYSSSSSSPGPRSRGQRLPFYLFCLIGIALLSAGPCWLLWYLNLDLFFEMLFESLSSLGSYLYIFFSILTKGKGETRVQETLVHSMDDGAWAALSPIAELPPSPGSSSEGSGDARNNPVPAAPPAPPAAPVPPAAPIPPVPPAAPIPPVPPAAPIPPVPPAAPIPPAPPVPPAGLADQLRNGLLEVANEPAGPTELPAMRRNMEAFFRHFENRKTSKARVDYWIWSEFSLDRALEDEKEHILGAINGIKEQHPPHSLSPAQAKDLLHEEVNRWLRERGRESLNLRKTGGPA